MTNKMEEICGWKIHTNRVISPVEERLRRCFNCSGYEKDCKGYYPHEYDDKYKPNGTELNGGDNSHLEGI